MTEAPRLGRFRVSTNHASRCINRRPGNKTGYRPSPGRAAQRNSRLSPLDGELFRVGTGLR